MVDVLAEGEVGGDLEQADGGLVSEDDVRLPVHAVEDLDCSGLGRASRQLASRVCLTLGHERARRQLDSRVCLNLGPGLGNPDRLCRGSMEADSLAAFGVLDRSDALLILDDCLFVASIVGVVVLWSSSLPRSLDGVVVVRRCRQRHLCPRLVVVLLALLVVLLSLLFLTLGLLHLHPLLGCHLLPFFGMLIAPQILLLDGEVLGNHDTALGK